MDKKSGSKIVTVDKNDNPIGLEDKLKCHLGRGILHRAFSVFIFNKKSELLIQKRSAEKMLWPLYWSNSCCSHPRDGEDFQKAGRRRLEEELGFDCPLKFTGKFQYQANYKKVGAENEVCLVLEGRYDGRVMADKREVIDFKWIGLEDLKKDMRKNSEKYTPWFMLELKKFF